VSIRYDTWLATGVSAYTGGLWLAAVQACEQMGRILGHAEHATRYHSLWTRGRRAYLHRLWRGRYLAYDERSDCIMADQLAGHAVSLACGLDGLLPPSLARAALTEVYRLNVRAFGEGSLLGAVNGMWPDGTVNETCNQSCEVWTGTTYAVAAAMLLESLRLTSKHVPSPRTPPDSPVEGPRPLPVVVAEGGDATATELATMALATAAGVHEAGWQRFGYFFATPEAWFRSGHYRALSYMRPLGIWGMEWVRSVTPRLWEEASSVVHVDVESM
jgi:non-lysosomal glucosylceramidase